jgi:predicted O-linked N-acetylglucosamine transferase (SPINDLY family)
MSIPDDLHARAWQHYQAGDRAQAERLCWDILREQPLHADAIYLLGVLALDADQPLPALLHFHHAATLQPTRPAFHNGLGEAYRALGRLEEAAGCFREALRLEPSFAAAHHALGLVLLDQGNLPAAITSFRQALAARPDYERAQVNLGRAFQMQGNLEAAAGCYAEAIRLKPDYAVAHNNLAVVHQAQGRHAEAIARLRDALRSQPQYPEAHFNLGTSLQALGDAAAARASFREALRRRPDYAKAHHGLGRALEALGEMPAAVASYREAIRCQPAYAEAQESLGNLLLLQPDWEGARAVFQQALDLQPDNAHAFSRLVYTRQVLCDWRTREADFDRLWHDAARSIDAGQPTAVVPFCALTVPWSAAQHLAVARSHADALARNLAELRASLRFDYQGVDTPRSREGKLRVGYLSAEFRDHAVGHAIQGLFGLHDRRHFEVFAYSLGSDDGSVYRQRIARDCDHFVDLAPLSLADSARRIHQDGIHLLIDLQGYTGFSRMGLLALRPAPIQVNYLGYSGSTGANFIDYLITDPVVTPPERAGDFREQPVWLPHTFMVTDHQQALPPPGASRAAEGLPADGFVFCGFHNSYKIEPRMFDVWMRLLAQVPGSVLWLMTGAPAAEANLRREAAARGVAAGRLVFAGHRPKAQHLDRLRLADLFLDALVYNAHTTAADALWVGLPLLTCPGDTFASRVAAGLLTAIGVPELIAPTLDEYEQRALHLARHPGELKELRQKLAAHRTTWPLFDTPRFVRNLERAYRAMWDLHASGESPQPINITD